MHGLELGVKASGDSSRMNHINDSLFLSHNLINVMSKKAIGSGRQRLPCADFHIRHTDLPN